MIRPRLTAKIARMKISVATLTPNGEHDRERQTSTARSPGQARRRREPPHVTPLPEES